MALSSEKLPFELVSDEEPGDDWTQLELRHDDGPIAAIERNPVEPGTLGSDEIEEFIEDLRDAKPASEGQWLCFEMDLANEEHRRAFLVGKSLPDVRGPNDD